MFIKPGLGLSIQILKKQRNSHLMALPVSVTMEADGEDQKSVSSFMLEGIKRQYNAADVLQSVEEFFKSCAEELEIVLMEMVKEDNRLELNARIEELEKEVIELKQVLYDKKEQETAMLQVLMKVEQDQKLTEDARLSAEQDAAAQRYAVHVLQEKNEKLVAQLAQMEKRVVTAETTLEATLQYESGQNKALASPRFARTQGSAQETLKKKTGFLSFGLGWRERNKAKQSEESNGDSTSNATSEVKSPSKESKSEDLLNLETRR